MANDRYDFKTGTPDTSVNVETGLYFGADSQSDADPAPRPLSALAEALRVREETLTNKTIDVIERPAGNLTVPNVQGTIATVEQLTGAAPTIPDFTQAGTGAITRTWQAKARDTISAWDFIPVGTNTAAVNCASYLQAAATAAAGKRLYIPAGTYLINSVITLSSDTEVCGDGSGTVIKLNAADISGFFATSKTGVVVRSLKILSVISGTAAYTGGVQFESCTYCDASDIECVGMSWAGIYLNNTNNSRVSRCRFTGWLGTAGDRADIMLFNESNYNLVTENLCYGGGEFGIMIMDPYTPATPTGNVVFGNQVGEHTAYGIAIYTSTGYDTQTIIANNKVRDILGTYLSGASGAGIFVQSGGGTVVTGNSVSNCCRSTSNFETLGIAGISATVGEYGSAVAPPIVISNNHVNAARGAGIFATASNKSVVIEANTVRSTGTTAVRGEAIIASNVQAAKIRGNIVYHDNSNYYAVRVTAVTTDYSYNEVSGNSIHSSNGGGLLINKSGGSTGTYYGLVSGNTIWLANASNIGINLDGAHYLRAHGNSVVSSGPALYASGCLGGRWTGNTLVSSYGTYNIIWTGTSTGTIADESNLLSGIIQNDGGVIISQYANAAPVAGTRAVGDRVIQSVPVAGSPKGWRCTVAGTPGTWVSEGNL